MFGFTYHGRRDAVKDPLSSAGRGRCCCGLMIASSLLPGIKQKILAGHTKREAEQGDLTDPCITQSDGFYYRYILWRCNTTTLFVSGSAVFRANLNTTAWF